VIPDLNGCPGPSKNFKAEVKPKPDAWFQPPSDTVCAGTSKTIHILSHTAGTFFTWTATGTPSISGYSNGSGNQILQPLFNSSLNEGTTTYTVTPVAASCNGNQYSTQRTVFPVPVVTLTTCTDTMTTLIAKPITLKGGIPLGGTYSGSGVNSLTGIFTPSLAGTGTHTITYTYANRFGCPVAATLRIRVFNPAAFTCGDNLLDIRDGRTYPTVDIGTQCWMAANLNYGTRIISTQVQRDNCQAEKYCYNNINANCGPYGGFYQWDEMMQYQDAVGIQGFCPPGWHIPSEAEWNTLFTHYINNGFAAAALKSTGFSGFNAGLFGTNYLNHSPDFFNFATMIWSSTSHGPVKAWAHGMNDPDASASYYPASRANAFQVRCLKD
jgi:uncharacterized protein (TIGR02145 family)